jgi:hypothetical protein
MNIVSTAAVESLFGHDVHHVIGARRELNGAVDVEDLHPAPVFDAAVPAPGGAFTSILLLRRNWGRGQSDHGDGE